MRENLGLARSWVTFLRFPTKNHEPWPTELAVVKKRGPYSFAVMVEEKNERLIDQVSKVSYSQRHGDAGRIQA